MDKNRWLVGVILAIGVLVAAAVVALSGSAGRWQPAVAANSLQWARNAGSGLSVPACTSSSNSDPTCLMNGSTSVTVSWDYKKDSHGACSSALLYFSLGPKGPEKMKSNKANSRMAYGVMKGRLYVAGGGGLGRETWYYDPGSDSWSEVPDAPAAFSGGASGVVGGKLYALAASPSKAVYQFDPSGGRDKKGSWATKNPPPSWVNLTWARGAVFNGKIYSFTGAEAQAYDPAADSWTKLASIPRYHGTGPAVAEANGLIYVIGGYNGGPLPYVDIYNPSADCWYGYTCPNTSKAKWMPLARAYASAVSYGTKIYVFGGQNFGYCAVSGTYGCTEYAENMDIWEYDTAADTWTSIGYAGPWWSSFPSEIGRDDSAVGVIGNYIYYYGGENMTALNDTERFSPSVADFPGLGCTDSYTWNGGAISTTYFYQALIKSSGNYLIDESTSTANFTTPNCKASVADQAPVAVAKISTSADSASFSGSITVQHGVPTSVYLSAASSSDPDGWASPTLRGVYNGSLLKKDGKCEWNSDLNQGTPTFDKTITNPKQPSDCDIPLGRLTFNDAPGTYTYQVLRITDIPGMQSNVATVSVNVTSPGPLAPSADIKANGSNGPITIDYNTSANLTWSSLNVTSCFGSDFDTGNATSNAVGVPTGNLMASETYTLNCTGPNGPASDSVTVNVPPPTADIKASLPGGMPSDGPITIPYNSSAIISWNSTNVESCAVSPTGWAGTSNTGISTGNLTASQIYTLNCARPDGLSASDSVTVNVQPPPVGPLIHMYINGTEKSGASFASPATYTISWSLENGGSDSCSGSGWNPGNVTVSGQTGSQTFSNVGLGAYTYALSCTGPAGPAVNSVTVMVSLLQECNPSVPFSCPQ